MDNPFKQSKIEKIEKIGLDKSAGLQDAETQLSTQTRIKFDEALAKADPSRIQVEAPPVVTQQAPEVDKKPSLLDIAGQPVQPDQAIPPPTASQVLDRADLTKQKFSNAIDLVKQNLDIPIGAPERASMTASLQHADKYLNQAVTQATGVETKTAIDTSERPPLMRFLNYLTAGQNRLDSLISSINSADLQHNQMSPGALLGVQIRLGFVQTELEFFTNVLNKALESTKTIMNVQI
jgi:hypothetical protein